MSDRDEWGFWETEHYELVITPQWVRKDSTFEVVRCTHCGGRGMEGMDVDSNQCTFCEGTGEIKKMKKIPPPPRISDALECALMTFVERYEEDEEE